MRLRLQSVVASAICGSRSCSYGTAEIDVLPESWMGLPVKCRSGSIMPGVWGGGQIPYSQFLSASRVTSLSLSASLLPTLSILPLISAAAATAEYGLYPSLTSDLRAFYGPSTRNSQYVSTELCQVERSPGWGDVYAMLCKFGDLGRELFVNSLPGTLPRTAVQLACLSWSVWTRNIRGDGQSRRVDFGQALRLHVEVTGFLRCPRASCFSAGSKDVCIGCLRTSRLHVRHCWASSHQRCLSHPSQNFTRW